ncbi:hypothetical protein F2Q69_00059679 [Brassica cretica]|uniref:Uncharacterized protein n=1 Tax=Brassica cretica TaxID=69181 RepID=A0A8S9RM98_BRACR|nr:hypothetical protein F2Q69_00059679 [Brassica cretica]
MPFERSKTDNRRSGQKVNPLVKDSNQFQIGLIQTGNQFPITNQTENQLNKPNQTGLTGQRLDSLSRLGRVTELPASHRRPVAGGGQQQWWLTGKSPVVAAEARRRRGGGFPAVNRRWPAAVAPANVRRRRWRVRFTRESSSSACGRVAAALRLKLLPETRLDVTNTLVASKSQETQWLERYRRFTKRPTIPIGKGGSRIT